MKKILLLTVLLSLALPAIAQVAPPVTTPPIKHPYLHKMGHDIAAPFVWIKSKFSKKPAPPAVASK